MRHHRFETYQFKSEINNHSLLCRHSSKIFFAALLLYIVKINNCVLCFFFLSEPVLIHFCVVFFLSEPVMFQLCVVLVFFFFFLSEPAMLLFFNFSLCFWKLSFFPQYLIFDNFNPLL
jgi:hypothetical protein